MMPPILALIILFVAAAGLLLWLYSRLGTAKKWEPDLGAWWQSFRPERYAPMARLLSSEDKAYLRTLPGYRPGMERRLRRHRLAVFRCYLVDIQRDYEQLHAIGSEMAASQMSAELHNQLFDQRVRFTRAVWRVRCQLLVYQAGFGTVDTAALVDSLRTTARLYQPALAASVA